MSNTAGASMTDAEQLTSFLAGLSPHREALPHRLHDKLLRRVPRLAPDLDDDLHEEVVQRLWHILLQRPPRFDEKRGSVWTYLDLVLKSAARDVRAANAHPGQRTRLQKDENGDYIKPQRPLSLDEKADDESEGALNFSETLADPNCDVQKFWNQHDAQELLRLMDATAPAPASQAMRLLYRDELHFQDAATAVGLNRFKLRRIVDDWVSRNDGVLSAWK